MKYKAVSLILFILLFSFGCAPSTIQLTAMDKIDSIPPKVEQTHYLYSSGIGQRVRAVLIEAPGIGIEIVPYSVQIIKTTGTFEEAMAFMHKGAPLKKVDIQNVLYRGRLIGYLLTYEDSGPLDKRIDVNLYERSGKIYFAILEKWDDKEGVY